MTNQDMATAERLDGLISDIKSFKTQFDVFRFMKRVTELYGARAFMVVQADQARANADAMDALRQAGRPPSPFAGIPIVNAGPWGRDYHTVLERMHALYAFRVLPDLIAEICARVL